MCTPAILLTVLAVGAIGAQVSGQGYRSDEKFVQPTCPQGYFLEHGLCYKANAPTAAAPQVVEPQKFCPPGYYLYKDTLCYLQNQACCPEAPTATTTPRTPASESPSADALTRCPPDTVFMDEMCRKLICAKGEYHEGRCVQAACPLGTVWFGKRCQPPGYVTTILEIENRVHNIKRYGFSTENINVVEINTQAPYNETVDDVPGDVGAGETLPSIDSGSSSTTTSTTSTTELPPGSLFGKCCNVITARLCKLYGARWVCFNQRRHICDARVCVKPLVYLKPPEAVYNPPLLVMPPNPPLLACKSSAECSDGDVVDCSGCVHNDRSRCSLYCYQYRCPNDRCHFMDMQDFCKIYPGELGCTTNEGCIWDWCGKTC